MSYYEPPAKVTAFFKDGNTPRQYGKGQIILESDRDDGKVYCCFDGFIKIYTIAESGEKRIFTIAVPKTMFPLTNLTNLLSDFKLYEPESVIYFESMSDLEVFIKPAQEMADYAKSDQDVMRSILEQTALRKNLYAARLSALSRKDSNATIAYSLVEFCDRFGKQENGDITIETPFTHEDIASLSGVVRESASRVFIELKKQGIVEHEGRAIVVHDIEALRELAHI